MQVRALSTYCELREICDISLLFYMLTSNLKRLINILPIRLAATNISEYRLIPS